MTYRVPTASTRPSRLSRPKTSLRWLPFEAIEEVGVKEEEEGVSVEVAGEVKTGEARMVRVEVKISPRSPPTTPQGGPEVPDTPPNHQNPVVTVITVMVTRHFSVWPH